MGKSKKKQKTRKKKKEIDAQIIEEKEEEKKVETEITSFSSTNSGNSSTNTSPNPSSTDFASNLDPLFTFEILSKTNTLNLDDSLKIKFIITRNAETAPEGKYLYKLYYVTNTNKKFLLRIGQKVIKKAFKISYTLKFNSKIPPSPLFNFEIELYQARKLIKTFQSEDFVVSTAGSEEQIKIHDMEFYSNILFPQNPFVFWIHLSSKPIPDSLPLDVQFSLLDKNLVLEEKSFKIRVGGPEIDPKKIYKYPFHIQIPRLENKDKNLKIKVVILEPEHDKALYSKKFTIPMEISLTGLRFEHVGYMRDLELGEMAYMLGDIINKTPYNVKGKAKFFFYSYNMGEFLCFTRNYRIQEDNYEKISEDVPLLEYLGGEKYWVVCHTKIKVKGLNYKLEGLSKPRMAKIPEIKPFYAKIRASIQNPPLKINQIVPIGIDVRIRAQNQFRPIYCEIFENFENVSDRTLYRFKIRHLDSDHSKFHWKIPSRYGKYTLGVRFFYKYAPINPGNIEKNELKFEIFP